jgi:hypothetical protein
LDLTHAPTIIVTCACGHQATVSVAFIKKRVRGYLPLDDLKYVLRYRECDQRGNISIDARAALGHGRR